MRLIDADALHAALKAKQKWVVKCGDKHNEGYTYDQVHFAIDDAPTIEDYKLDEWCDDCKEYDHKRHCCPRFNRVIRETVADFNREHHKKGKWIECDRCHIECPFCHSVWADFENMVERFNYCPNCGAKMGEVKDVQNKTS